jgi:HTH-type transcriptional regulator/antitoxin HigA
MQIKSIKIEQDYQQALKRLEKIFTAKPDTKKGEELEIIGKLPERCSSAFNYHQYTAFLELKNTAILRLFRR